MSPARHATGQNLIAASRQAAYEGYKGHGVLTYALLEALHKSDGRRRSMPERRRIGHCYWPNSSCVILGTRPPLPRARGEGCPGGEPCCRSACTNVLESNVAPSGGFHSSLSVTGGDPDSKVRHGRAHAG